MDRVTRCERVTRRLHQAERYPGNPVLVGDNPWEKVASLYGTVLFDESSKLFRMWYLTGPYSDAERIQVRRREALSNITLCGYATSTDGFHWDKPSLGQLDVEGSAANNLIDIGRTNCEGIAVLHDPDDDDPSRRYKAIYWEHGGIDTFRPWKGKTIWGEGEGDGVWMSFSEDGIHWRDCGANPAIPFGSDTTQSLVRDPYSGQYVAFGRFGKGRRVARSVSDDAVSFSDPDLVLDMDDHDEEHTQFYGMPVDIYEGLYLGFLWVYREGVDGTIDTALATSRDGIHWERTLDRQTFLPLGEAGSWEDGMTRISQRVITVGDQLYFYYGGVDGPHTGRKFETVERRGQSAIGLATLRRDGFVSVDAGSDEGFLLTHPLELGDELHINADATHGQIIAEVTDDIGNALPGFTSSAVTGDSTDVLVRFDQPLTELQGQQSRLKFRLRDSSLFSYWFETA